jgi:hypothetical protein
MTPPGAANNRKVLFIGNSFTARNDLPGLVAHLAAARGHALHTRLITAGGASLGRHWNAGEAARAIAEGGYHQVVLQEQSTLPIKSAPRMHANVRLFDAAIRAAGAQTVLYMTWARRHAPQTQAALAAAYQDIGRELGAVVVGVGLAWKRFLAAYDEPVLHDKDGSHPTLAGSYLAACVFLTVLFGEDPRGIECDLPGLGAPQQALLQQSAWQAGRPWA